jgi:predicted  nucleic acid-binding Zn-ribbon protein
MKCPKCNVDCISTNWNGTLFWTCPKRPRGKGDQIRERIKNGETNLCDFMRKQEDLQISFLGMPVGPAVGSSAYSPRTKSLENQVQILENMANSYFNSLSKSTEENGRLRKMLEEQSRNHSIFKQKYESEIKELQDKLKFYEALTQKDKTLFYGD